MKHTFIGSVIALVLICIFYYKYEMARTRLYNCLYILKIIDNIDVSQLSFLVYFSF